MFKTTENFKIPLIKEIISQILRFTIVPLAIIYFLKEGSSNQVIVFITLLAIILTHLLSLLFLTFTAKKKIGFLKVKSKDLSKTELKDLKRFLLPLTATATAGMFFGYIDTFMLGHYVSEKFIAYYAVAFSLVGGAAAIIGFAAVALMPAFARNTGKTVENIFRKTRNLIIFISLMAGLFTYFIAKYIVIIAYGVEYLPSVQILQLFSILVFLLPIIGLYVGYYAAQKRTKELAWIIIGSAILNVVFNYMGIVWGINNYGMIGGVYGAVSATILSKMIYMCGLLLIRKVSFNNSSL